MPYVFYEEDALPEGAETVEAFSAEDYNALAEQRNQLTDQLAESKASLAALHEKYAKAVLGAAGPKPVPGPDPKPRQEEPELTYSNLFV